MEIISNTIFLSCFVLFLASTLVFTSTQEVRLPNWEEWKKAHGKTYSSVEEEHMHEKIWIKNAKFVEQHNERADASYSVELNSFADQILPRRSLKLDGQLAGMVKQTKKGNSPKNWDWRSKGVVSPVKNQGQLGDVLSFVATECVESLHAIKTGRLTLLSVAETHDCCVKQPLANKGVFDCIRDIGGLCSETDYPRSVGKCMNNTCTAVAKISGAKWVPRGNEDALKDAVSTEPVMVLIDASHVSFQLYRAGVYSDPDCTQTNLDHAVQIVGYGTMGGQDYWICKNSWGTSWGMNGYVLIARNKENMCGIATMAFYPD